VLFVVTEGITSNLTWGTPEYEPETLSLQRTCWTDVVIPGRKIDDVPCLSMLYAVSRHPSSSVAIHHSSYPATTAAHVAPSVNLSVRPWKGRLSVDTFCLLIYTVDSTCTKHRQVR